MIFRLCSRIGVRVLLAVIGSLWLGHEVQSQTAQPDAHARIVSIGGSVTEVVYRLGAGDRLVGADTSSIYPEAATRLPQVGYQRMLSVEGVLSLQPSLILASADAGPPEAVTLLQGAGTPIVTVPNEPTLAGAQRKIRVIAEALGRKAKGEALAATVARDIAVVRHALRHLKSRPRVLFIYARGQGAMSVSGAGTSADAMIALAGGVNAVTEYTGFKPLTPEAVIAAAPDILLIPERGLASIGGMDPLLAAPGVALTPAGRARRIVAMDDLRLLGFGPRLGQAVQELAAHFHPDFHLKGSMP
jgi:iron complex transport system substrate-binding protein